MRIPSTNLFTTQFAFSTGSKSVDDTISLRFIWFVRRGGGFEMLSDQRVVRLWLLSFFFFFFRRLNSFREGTRNDVKRSYIYKYRDTRRTEAASIIAITTSLFTDLSKQSPRGDPSFSVSREVNYRVYRRENATIIEVAQPTDTSVFE